MELKYRVVNGTFDVTTDHYPIIIDLPSAEHQSKKETTCFRRTKNININTTKSDFHQVFQKMDVLDDIDFKSRYNKYVTLSQEVVDKHVPIITRTVCNWDGPPWMDSEYKTNRCKRRKRRKLEKRWKGDNTEENWTAYVEQRQLCAEMSPSKQKNVLFQGS